MATLNRNLPLREQSSESAPLVDEIANQGNCGTGGNDGSQLNQPRLPRSCGLKFCTVVFCFIIFSFMVGVVCGVLMIAGVGVFNGIPLYAGILLLGLATLGLIQFGLLFCVHGARLG